MKKFLLVTYRKKGEADTPKQTVILEGDSRMTNQRMIEEYIREYVDSEAEWTDDHSFETDSETFELTNVEIVSEEEAEQQQNQNRYWSYQVNENVTDPASRYSYSGRVPGA